MTLEFNKIYNMDAMEGLKQIDDESIDAIVSDPPYQLTSIKKTYSNRSDDSEYDDDSFDDTQIKKGFMNKEWDVLPSTEVLKETLRVLKSGAFAMWLMTPRQDSQLEFLLRLREAGFIIAFSPIYWTYASGFPKAMNISKAVDKKLGFERETTGFDRKRSPEHNDYGIYNVEWERKDKPASPEAKALDGSYGGFQPKPAVEVIIVSMKPLSEKSYVDQALKNRKGITWLDDAHIPYQTEEDKSERVFGSVDNTNVFIERQKRLEGKLWEANNKGRFPANLLVSDNVLDMGLNKISKRSLMKPDEGGTGNSLMFKHEKYEFRGYDDAGDFSRYFSLDAWWENKLKELPDEVQMIFPFLYAPKASKSERNKGLEHLPERPIDFDSQTRTNKETADKYSAEQKARMQNHHPTVKPIKLMSYLITLTTREGDVVLDPFIGSGTTAISALLLNRKFIGFERDPEYFIIAEERVGYYYKQYKRQTKLDMITGGE